MELMWTPVFIILCILFEGFFSGSEIGVISADRIKLRHEAAKGSRGARLALDMLKKPEWLLSTTLVGTNISVVVNTTLITAVMLDLFGARGSLLAVCIVAPLGWIFGEIVPKSIFQQRADTITPRIIYLLRIASYLFFPILFVFNALTRIFTMIFGKQDHMPFTLREQILTMLHIPSTEGDIQPLEKDMIRRVFNLSDTSAYEIMVPLIEMVAVEQSQTCGEAVRLAGEKDHIRLPVYAERVDRVVGVLNVMDLMGADPDSPLAPYIHSVRFVPTSKSISELFVDLRKERDVLAIVVDEYGGAEGLITIEDIMEEVVEELEDEYDSAQKPSQWVRKISKKEYIVSARIEIDTLEDELGITLSKGNYATLAGFLLEKAGDIPQSGTVIKSRGITFTVTRSSPQAIQEVRIRW